MKGLTKDCPREERERERDACQVCAGPGLGMHVACSCCPQGGFQLELFVAIGYECTVECCTTCSLYATVQEGTYRIAIASTGNCVCLHVTSIYSRYRRNCSL